MEEFLESVKSETKDLFHSKKNLINLLTLGILILALPLGLSALRQQQIIKSRAATDPITFTGSNVSQKNDGSWVAIRPQIQTQLNSPLGPPGTPGSPVPSPSGSPGPSPSGSPSPSPSTKTRLYIDPSQISPGASLTVTATGPATCSLNITNPPESGGGFSGCTNAGGFTCSNPNPKDSNQCWWKWACTAGTTVGSYTASFNASGTGCASSATYIIK